MATVKELLGICVEIYQQMYKEAKPPADFKKLMKEGKTNHPNWFMDHYLDVKRQAEIVNKVCKKHKISGIDKRRISCEIHLGAAPNTHKIK